MGRILDGRRNGKNRVEYLIAATFLCVQFQKFEGIGLVTFDFQLSDDMNWWRDADMQEWNEVYTQNFSDTVLQQVLQVNGLNKQSTLQ